jgi:uncharacterized membrane protein YkoI
MKRKSLIMASLGGVASLAITGAALGVTAADNGSRTARPALAAATADPTADDNPSPDDDATRGADPTGATPSAQGVGRERAGQLALAAVPGGRIVEIEAEQEHGRAVWSVKVVAGGVTHDVHVDRSTGAVLRQHRQPVDDHGGDRSGTDDRGGADDHGGDRSGDDH